MNPRFRPGFGSLSLFSANQNNTDSRSADHAVSFASPIIDVDQPVSDSVTAAVNQHEQKPCLHHEIINHPSHSSQASSSFGSKTTTTTTSSFTSYIKPLIELHRQDIKVASSSLSNETRNQMSSLTLPIDSFIPGLDVQSRISNFVPKVGDLLLGKMIRQTSDHVVFAALFRLNSNKRDLTRLGIEVHLAIEQKDKLALKSSNDVTKLWVTSVAGILGAQLFITVRLLDQTEHQDDDDDALLFCERKNSNKFQDILTCLEVCKRRSFANDSVAAKFACQVLSTSESSSPETFSLICGKHNNVTSSSFDADFKNLRRTQSKLWSQKILKEGVSLMKSGNESGALCLINKAIALDSENADALVARACLQSNQGDLESALFHFESALILQPNHSSAKKYLSQTLTSIVLQKKNNDHHAVKRMLEKALQVDPENKVAQKTLKKLFEDDQQEDDQQEDGRRRRSRSRSFSPISSSKNDEEVSMLKTTNEGTSCKRTKDEAGPSFASNNARHHHHHPYNHSRRRVRNYDHHDRRSSFRSSFEDNQSSSSSSQQQSQRISSSTWNWNRNNKRAPNPLMTEDQAQRIRKSDAEALQKIMNSSSSSK